MLAPIEWHDSSSLHQLEFLPGPVRETTTFARPKLLARGAPVQEQYLSRPVDVVQFGGSTPVHLPRLYLSGVRLLYKAYPSKKYARTEVFMAVPWQTLLPIVEKLAGRGVRFPGSTDNVQHQRFIPEDETEWVVFTSYQLDKPHVSVRVVRDPQDWDDLDLAAELASHRTDLIANVGFKVELKYRGEHVDVPEEAPMSLKLTAQSIHLCDLATAPLDP